ncbi:Cytochrome B translational activator protein cbs2 [Pestalotiopsis sp. IQ-011]
MPLVRNPIGTGTKITLLVSRMKEDVWTFSNKPEEEPMNDDDLTIDAQVTANNQALASGLVQMVKEEFGHEGYDLAHIYHHRPLDTGEDRFKNLNIWLINLWNMAYPRVGSTMVGPRIFTSLDPLGVAVDYFLQGYELETVWSVIN